MKRENKTGQPRATDRKPPHQSDDQYGGQGVQKHIPDMVAKNTVAPNPMFNPERAVEHGVVLLGRAELKPDPSQPFQLTQLRPGDVSVVVPEKGAVERGQINHYT